VKRVLVVNANASADTREGCRLIRGRLCALAPGTSVRVVHFAEVVGLDADAVVVGPQGTPWWAYGEAELAGVTRALRAAGEAGVPTLGICGGHQLIAKAFGGTVGLLGGAAGSGPCYTPALARERGPVELDVVADDALCAGLARPTFMQSHREEVRELPPGFRVLLSGGASRVQAMRHQRLPVWGVQFHPERKWREWPAGRTLMANWVRAAGLGG